MGKVKRSIVYVLSSRPTCTLHAQSESTFIHSLTPPAFPTISHGPHPADGKARDRRLKVLGRVMQMSGMLSWTS